MSEDSERIRQARLRAGLSLRSAAELLDLEPKQLGDLEHGRAEASAGELARILSKLQDAANTGVA